MSLSKQLAERRQMKTAERNRVLSLIDDHEWPVARVDLVQWFQRNNVPIPVNDELFLIEVHKMRATAIGFDLFRRAASIEWLRDRGVDL